MEYGVLGALTPDGLWYRLHLEEHPASNSLSLSCRQKARQVEIYRFSLWVAGMSHALIDAGG